MKLITALILSCLIFFVIWCGAIGLYKFSGGTFVDGDVVIYKGKELFSIGEGCSVSTLGDDFHEIKRVCFVGGNPVVDVWTDGIEVIK